MAIIESTFSNMCKSQYLASVTSTPKRGCEILMEKELLIFGQEKSGSLVDRTKNLEKDLWSPIQHGTLTQRIYHLENDVYSLMEM